MGWRDHAHVMKLRHSRPGWRVELVNGQPKVRIVSAWKAEDGQVIRYSRDFGLAFIADATADVVEDILTDWSLGEGALVYGPLTPTAI